MNNTATHSNATRKSNTKPKRLMLKRADFYDTYLISCVLNVMPTNETKYIATIVDEIAQKYTSITLQAVRTELMHTRNCTYPSSDFDKLCIDICLGPLSSTLPEWAETIIKNRKQASFSQAIEIFTNLDWTDSFGGLPWADIADYGSQLQNKLPVSYLNVSDSIVLIDYLNDLEHNNDLYLKGYATFDVQNALDNKYTMSPIDMIKWCSSEVRKICLPYLRRNKHLMN